MRSQLVLGYPLQAIHVAKPPTLCRARGLHNSIDRAFTFHRRCSPDSPGHPWGRSGQKDSILDQVDHGNASIEVPPSNSRAIQCLLCTNQGSAEKSLVLSRLTTTIPCTLLFGSPPPLLASRKSPSVTLLPATLDSTSSSSGASPPL
jgi:hypothetical protein